MLLQGNYNKKLRLIYLCCFNTTYLYTDKKHESFVNFKRIYINAKNYVPENKDKAIIWRLQIKRMVLYPYIVRLKACYNETAIQLKQIPLFVYRYYKPKS